MAEDWSWHWQHWQRLSMFFCHAVSWFGVIHCNPFTDAKVETHGARITARIRICCRFISVSKWLYDINEPPRCAPWIWNPKYCINMEPPSIVGLHFDLTGVACLSFAISTPAAAWSVDPSMKTALSRAGPPKSRDHQFRCSELGRWGRQVSPWKFVVARQVPTQKLCLHSWFF